MKKLSFFSFLILLFLSLPSQARGQVVSSRHQVQSESAVLTSAIIRPMADTRAAVLKAYLTEYNSPMSGSADHFVREADRNALDWKLVAAIAGVESYYGLHVPANSYNAWGFGVYGTNVRYFSDWNDGITVVSTALRENYMDRWGATDAYSIGKFYAADPKWAAKVMHFYEEIEAFSTSYQNTTLSISL